MNSKITYIVLFILSFTTHAILGMHGKRLQRSLSCINVKAAMLDKDLLHQAVKHSNLIEVKKLLTFGTNVNAQDREGNSALHHATNCSNHNSALTKLLVLYGADLKLRNKEGQTPYNFIMRSDNKIIKKSIWLLSKIQELIKKNANVVSHPKKRRTPLHEAVELKDLAVVQRLLELNADPNSKDKIGNTPLHYAIQLKDIPIIKELIWQGAQLDVPNKDKITPWHLTSDDTVLQHGISLICYGYALLKEQKLLSQSPPTSYMKGGTPLHRAIHLQDSELLWRLLSLGAQVDSCDELGNTPLHIAASHCNEYPIITLLQAGAKPYSLNVYGQTPEAKAIQAGNLVFERLKNPQSFIS